MFEEIKNRFFLWLEKVLPYEEYAIIRSRYCWLTTPKEWKNKYKFSYFLSKRPEAQKKYCILRLQMPQYALFAAGIQYIFMYDWAASRGYTPLLDIEYGYNFQRYMLGEDNVWEYCFEQSIKVKDAIKKEWVLVEDIGVGEKYRPEICEDINGKVDDRFIHVVKEGWREYYKKVNQYIQKTWVFKKHFLEECKNESTCKINKADKVLGVFLRENFSKDMEKCRSDNAAKEVYRNHPVTIGVKDTVQVVKEYMKKWNCNKIFLATVVQDSVDLFVEEFGQKVSWIERDRFSFADVISDSNIFWNMSEKELYERYNEKYGEKYLYNMTLSYAKEIYNLSCCDYLIATKSSGAAVALSLNGGKYEDIFILPDFNKIERY